MATSPSFRLGKYAERLDSESRRLSRPVWERALILVGFANLAAFFGIARLAWRSGAEISAMAAKHESFVLRDHNRYVVVEPWVYYSFNVYELVTMVVFFGAFALALRQVVRSYSRRANRS